MGVLENILAWVAKLIIEVLADRWEKRAKAAKDAAKLDKERGETNAENVAKYEADVERAAKIRDALNLLNGTRAAQ